MNKSTMTIVAALAAGAAVATTRTPYANDFTTRTSGATPSDRWMVSDYVPGALARSVGSISSHGREPYNSETAYQDGWTMKEGYERSSVLFRVVDDGGNQGVLVTNTSSTAVTDGTVAMQPFYNEFTDGVLKISADIRTPASSAFVSNTTAYASIIPVYKSVLNVAASTFPTPTRLGMANASYNGDFYVRANVMSKNIAETGSGTYGYSEARNNLTAGNWYRYEAVIDIAAGTFTATFGNLGATHPSPDSVPTTVTDFRRYVDNAWTTTFKLNNAPSASTGGFAGLVLYVNGFKKADAAAAPMFDNIAVSWKAPGADDFASVYENDFTTRRYRQVEPSGTISCAYALAPTTNTVQSSFYERASIANDYGISEDSARRLVPDGAPYTGQDGWRRIAGTAPFTMVDPNKDSTGYGWNNASVLRATKSGTTGMVAVPIGTTVSSGKVRLYCDILMGALTNSTSSARDISAAAFLAGDGAYTNDCYSSTRIRVADITTALRSKGVCGAGTCYGDRAATTNHVNTRLYRFNGSSYGTLKDTAGENVFISCGRWGRYVVTLDLDAGKYDVAIYNLGYVGQPMNFDHTTTTLLIATNNLSLAGSAIRNVDSVVLFSEGQDNANSGNRVTTFNSKKLGRFPLFDNVRVCLVNGDGTDGTELYSCNFEYGYRMSVQNATSLVGHSNREGADRWTRRGNAYGLFNVIDAGGGDSVLALDGFGWIEQVTRAGYAVQPFGASSRNCASVDFAADIRPPESFARTADCFARVEVGGDDYAQGVYRPASGTNWRSEPRIGFGFVVNGGKNAVGHYTNILISVQSRTSSATTTTNSAVAIDTSHWYRFRVKAAPTNAGGTFTVKVYDQGTTKPAASDADGTLVETFSDLALPPFDGEGMTTFGLAAAGFAGTRGGGLDDPNVALVDNLSVNFNPAAFVIVFK